MYGFKQLTADSPSTGDWIAYDNSAGLIDSMNNQTIRGEVGTARDDSINVLWTTGDSDTIALPSFEILAVSKDPPIQ
jgi:hypothetical protein